MSAACHWGEKRSVISCFSRRFLNWLRELDVTISSGREFQSTWLKKLALEASMDLLTCNIYNCCLLLCDHGLGCLESWSKPIDGRDVTWCHVTRRGLYVTPREEMILISVPTKWMTLKAYAVESWRSVLLLLWQCACSRMLFESIDASKAKCLSSTTKLRLNKVLYSRPMYDS